MSCIVSPDRGTIGGRCLLNLWGYDVVGLRVSDCFGCVVCCACCNLL